MHNQPRRQDPHRGGAAKGRGATEPHPAPDRPVPCVRGDRPGGPAGLHRAGLHGDAPRGGPRPAVGVGHPRWAPADPDCLRGEARREARAAQVRQAPHDPAPPASRRGAAGPVDCRGQAADGVGVPHGKRGPPAKRGRLRLGKPDVPQAPCGPWAPRPRRAAGRAGALLPAAHLRHRASARVVGPQVDHLGGAGLDGPRLHLDNADLPT